MAKTGIGILIASGVGITTGNIICVVQENKYINANLQSGESAFVSGSYVTGSNSNAEKILALRNEARQQPGYKTGLIIGGVSFGTALVGATLLIIGGTNKRKIRNAAEETVALLSFNCIPGGAQLSLAF